MAQEHGALEWRDVEAILSDRIIKLVPAPKDGEWLASMTATVRSYGSGKTEEDALASLKGHLLAEVNERIEKAHP